MQVFHHLIGASAIAFVLVCETLFSTSRSDGAQRISPAWQPASCRNSRVSRPEQTAIDEPLRIEADLNGDGLIDVLEAQSSCGSGACSKVVKLTLAGSGIKLEAGAEFSFMSIIAIDPVPKELLNPRHRDTLAWIEDALFPRVCESPDPSLAWLLAPQKRLNWIEGSPQMPTQYAMRVLARRVAALPGVANVSRETIDVDGEVWLFYAGGVHTMNAYKLVELARKGSRVLLGTAHGVILTNPERSKHAWIYVHPGNGEVKLRSPSIAGAQLHGDTAIITLNKNVDPDLQPELQPSRKGSKPRQVRIKLTTGAILK